MRRIFLCSVIMTFCLATPAFSQFVVSDPALTQLSQITWAKELEQAYEQFKVLDNSRNILTESLDLYRKVSGLIQNSKMVLNVLKLQGEMLKISATECSRTDIYTQEGIMPIPKCSMILWRRVLHPLTFYAPSFRRI